MCDSCSSIASASTAMSQARVSDAVNMKVLKLANDEQKSAAKLVTDALQQAREIQAGSTGENGTVDTLA